MKCKLLTLLTCFHALSPTASTCDILTKLGGAGGSAAPSSSVDTTPRHGLCDVTGIPAVIIAKFLAGIPTPTNAAGACEIVRLITEGKPFSALSYISPVSIGVGECFECTEIREQLDAAVKEAIKEAIQILNDATDGVCDLEGEEFRAALRNIRNQPPYTSTNHSENAQNLAQLGKHFESLAGAYKLLIKGSCEDPQATKLRVAHALRGASIAFSFVTIWLSSLGNHAATAQAKEKCATLDQEVVEIYSVLEDRENQAVALQYAAEALSSAADSHTRACNHGDAAARHTESAALHMRCADIFENMARQANISRNRARQAENLGAAASTLSSAADSHTLAGNHGDAAARHTESAALHMRCADIFENIARQSIIFGELNRERQAVKLGAAARALYSAASSHNRAGNHAGAIDCYTASAALYQRCAEMYHGLGKSIEEADALKSAASALRNAAVVHFQLLRKHADAIDCYTASAALSQRCAKMYHVSGKSREEADALKSAAEALHDAAISHFQLGNYADAIDCNTESAALFQSCAEMYGLLEAPTEKACALKGAASALRNAAVSHSQLGNYEAAAKATRESAELYQSCAKVYHGLGKSREEADALKSAAGALSSLASLHTLADNHAAAAQAYEKRAAYTS